MIKNLYHKIRFIFKSFLLPKTLLVGNTLNKLLVHNWPTAMDIFNGSTIVKNGRMFYEPKEYNEFEKLAIGKKVFFDIGSHIGWYCLIANGIGIDNCYAFDIVNSFVNLTKKNFKLNNIKNNVFRVAFGVPGNKVSFKQSIFSGNEIAISLDDFCEINNIWPDIIKIDIEGAELDILMTMNKVLSKHPAIDISIHPAYLNERGQKEEDVLQIFEKYEYKIKLSFNNTYFLI